LITSLKDFEKKKYLQHLNASKNLLTTPSISALPSLTWLSLNGFECLIISDNKLTDLNMENVNELVHLEARGI
jgi:Leucine-rich repeat (LRR) protein